MTLGNDMTIYIDNLELYSVINGISALDKIAGLSFNDFDHINREWHKTNYTSRELINLSFKKMNDSMESINIPYDIFNTVNLQKGLTNFKHPFALYDILKTTEITIKVLRFTTYGNLMRDCGQMLFINSGNTNLTPEFLGPWYIYSIEHVWTGKQYKNRFYMFSSV